MSTDDMSHHGDSLYTLKNLDKLKILNKLPHIKNFLESVLTVAALIGYEAEVYTWSYRDSDGNGAVIQSMIKNKLRTIEINYHINRDDLTLFRILVETYGMHLNRESYCTDYDEPFDKYTNLSFKEIEEKILELIQ